jgi:hypothetical protein
MLEDRSVDPEEPLRVYADPAGHLLCIIATIAVGGSVLPVIEDGQTLLPGASRGLMVPGTKAAAGRTTGIAQPGVGGHRVHPGAAGIARVAQQRLEPGHVRYRRGKGLTSSRTRYPERPVVHGPVSLCLAAHSVSDCVRGTFSLLYLIRNQASARVSIT